MTVQSVCITCHFYSIAIFIQDSLLFKCFIFLFNDQERRIKAISEVTRILRVGGKALIYVWAMEQNLNQKQSKYIKPNRQKQLDEEKSVSCFETESSYLEKSKQLSQLSSSAKSESVGVINVRHKKKPTEKSSLNESILSTSSESKELIGAYRSQLNEEKTNSLDGESESQFQPTKSLRIHVNRTQFEDQDMLVPWKLKEAKTNSSSSLIAEVNPPSNPQLFHRYYHVFRQGELEALCKRVPNCAVIKSYYDQGNWCVVLEKC